MSQYQESAHEIVCKIHARELDVGSFIAQRLSKIEEKNHLINACYIYEKDFIDQQVNALERRLKLGEKPKLAGIPVVIKDNILVKGQVTSCASKMLQNYKSSYTATVVQRLMDHGAIIMARSNMDEFGMGSSSEHSVYGPCSNPWDYDYVAGGSSGGSAAAVAASLVPVALGSDTGGSVRQPASFCGLFGLKPTYGRVSRFGLVAYGSSLDQIGPLCRYAQDLALMFPIIAGEDSLDGTTKTNQKSHTIPTWHDLKGTKIGIIQELSDESGIDPKLQPVFDTFCDQLKNLGAQLSNISLPSLTYAVPCYYLLACAEASANLARYDGVRYGHRASGSITTLKEFYKKTRTEGFGPEVKQRIMLGTFALCSGYYDAYYGQAMKIRKYIAFELAQAFKQYDFLVSLTSPVRVYKKGQPINNPVERYLTDLCTVPANLSAIPAINVPIALDQQGLPIGGQIMAAWNQDEQLIALAQLYEQTHNFWKVYGKDHE